MIHKGDHSGVPGGTRVKMTWREMLAHVERLNVVFNGKDLRQKTQRSASE